MQVTRRSVLQSAGAVLTSQLLPGWQANRPLGLALYTVREAFARRPAAVLKLASEIGYTELEILRYQIATVTPLLETHGLRAVSVHFETPLITGNWQAWKDAEMPPVDDRLTFERVIEDTRVAGIRNLVFNYLPPKERGDLDSYRGLSDKLNAAAQKCHAAGMRLWYHNHNFEFAQKSGGRPIDVLLERLDPKLISLEVDAFWVSMAGLDPAAFIRQHKGRVIAMHLKDRGKGAVVPKFDIASVPKDTYEEIGRGELNIRELLRSAIASGVKHYFVEQDHSPDPLQSIRRSYAEVRQSGY